MRALWMTAAAALLALGAPAGDAAAQTAARDTATFAAGCFWCVEEAFDGADGVLETVSGYMGGRTRNPTYEQVSAGGTGHAEVVRVVFDPRRTSYAELLDVFWRNVDPLTANRQFCDRGDQYRGAIFAHGAEQRRAAEASRQTVARRFRQPVVTEINDAATFYPAEAYHQDYYQRNPVRYRYYKYACGRAARLEEVWGKK